MLSLLGVFVPVVRENMEMLYQFELDYRFDSGKVERAFGLTVTTLPRRYCRDVEGLKGHALDCDSTIVRNDRVPPPVLDVIAEARRRNVTVILVTGRILKYPRRAILSIYERYDRPSLAPLSR